MRKNKILLKIHCRSFMDTILPLKRTYRDTSNNTVKGYMMTIKEMSYTVKAVT